MKSRNESEWSYILPQCLKGAFRTHRSDWSSVTSSCLKGTLVTHFCIFPREKSVRNCPDDSPVYLNVYDLTPANCYVYWAGLGIFHSGVEVHGVEYAFGAHDFSSSGVFEVEPRKCPGFIFRKSIFMGMTSFNPAKIREFMEHQSTCYSGDTYNLISKNCNHFTDDICYKLTGQQIPKWVNRLARIGSVCNCVLPENLRAPTLQPKSPSLSARASEKKRLRTCLSILMQQNEMPLSSSMFVHTRRSPPPFSSSDPKRPKHTFLKEA